MRLWRVSKNSQAPLHHGGVFPPISSQRSGAQARRLSPSGLYKAINHHDLYCEQWGLYPRRPCHFLGASFSVLQVIPMKEAPSPRLTVTSWVTGKHKYSIIDFMKPFRLRSPLLIPHTLLWSNSQTLTEKKIHVLLIYLLPTPRSARGPQIFFFTPALAEGVGARSCNSLGRCLSRHCCTLCSSLPCKSVSKATPWTSWLSNHRESPRD